MKISKKLITPFLSLAALLAMGIGATYALFTSEAKTDISITAGKVNLKSSLSGLELYSASVTDDDQTGIVLPGSHDLGQYSADYYHVKQVSKFSNGGTGTLTDGNLALVNMTAGDMAKAQLDITNYSNVKIKYRLLAECTDEEESSLRLFAGLEFSAFGEDLTGVRKYVTNWKLLDENGAIASTPVKVGLPITSELQELHCNIRFSVEAVQQNAYTVDEAGKYHIEFADEPVVVDPDTGDLEDLTFKYGEPTEPEVVVTVPASQGTIVATTTSGEKPIEVGDQITCRITELAEGEAGSLVVAADEVAKNYEIALYNQDEEKIVSTSSNIAIYIEALELDILEVQHDGVTVPYGTPTVAGGEYYEILSGYIVIYTSNFSPFNVRYAAPVEYEGSGTEADPFIVDDVRKFLAIDTKGFETPGKVYYKLTEDIDLDDVDISERSEYISISELEVMLNLDLNGHKVENIKTHIIYCANNLNIHDGELSFAANKSACVLYYIYEGYSVTSNTNFENLILSGYQNVNSYHYGPLICYAYSRNSAALKLETTIKNVVNNLTIINTHNNGDTGGLLGYVQGPYVMKIEIANCQFNGKIQSFRASGFINECCRASAYTGYKEQNMARITSTGNSLAGQLIASASATAFGGRQAAANGDITTDAEWNAAWNGSVTLKPGYIITTQAPVNDMVVNAGSLAKGDAIVINHTRSTAVKYLVAYNYWYRSTAPGSFGGFPECIIQEIEASELGQLGTQFFNAKIADAEEAGASTVWYDSVAKEYKYYREGYALLADWAEPMISVQAFDANNALVAYQNYTITFDAN